MSARPRPLSVYVELGRKRTFASAIDWPGWSRGGKTEEQALASLADYAPRFAPVADAAGLSLPAGVEGDLDVRERVRGNATTEFGALGVVADVDRARVTAAAARRLLALLQAAWSTLDDAVVVAPSQLRKGPRGGGRDRDAMVAHVLGAEAAYARKIGVRHRQPELGDQAALDAVRADIVEALGRPSDGEPLVERGWPARYAVRRMAWHVLDHVWEMQDKSEPAG